jgi:hypothetical protein
LDQGASGITAAHMSSSPVVCFLSPWSLIRELASEQVYKRLSDIGAYVLFCRNPEGTLQFRVGESAEQGLVNRVATHELRDKSSIEQVFLVTYRDGYDKGRLHTRFLQQHIYRMAMDACALPPVLPQLIEADPLPPEEAIPLKSAINHVYIAARSLGLDIFKHDARYPRDRSVFRITTKHGVWAEGWDEPNGSCNGFLVRAGSMIATNVMKSLDSSQSGYGTKRDSLLRPDGPIRNLNGQLRFITDYWFSSRYQAASIVLGQRASDTKGWEAIT